MTDAQIRRLIVIGASAGGIEALLRVLPGLPSDLPASICIVVHTSPRAKSLLPHLLSKAGHLKVKYAEDGERLEPSQIYVAPPDFHVLIENNKLRVTHGPRENLSRPAIDPLFRTAAAEFDGSVIGVILSGMLDDGTNGLLAIKAAGGITIVQNPEDSSFSGMPHNAIEHVNVDYILRTDDIAKKLVMLCVEANASPIVRRKPADGDNRIDSYSCPECGGVLKEDGTPEALHFSCHVGHKVSSAALLTGQISTIERSLWSAVRALRERAALSVRIADRLRQRQVDTAVCERYERQAQSSLLEADEIIAVINRRREIDDTGISAAVDYRL